MLPAHAQMTPCLPWRTIEQHRAVIERAAKIGTLPPRGHWYGDDGSIRRGRTGDMVAMIDDINRAARRYK